MFCLVATLLSADQNLLAPNLTAVAKDFNFTDAERDKYLGGVISAAFFLLGAPAALLIGYLSDTMNRAKLLFWVVLLGMLANPLCMHSTCRRCGMHDSLLLPFNSSLCIWFNEGCVCVLLCQLNHHQVL